MAFSEKILHSAEEGIVLLRNNDNVLPIVQDDRISVFGRIQHETYRCGTGSGGSVHVPYITNIIDSLRENAKKVGFQINEELSNSYIEHISKNPFDNGGGQWGAEPWSQKDLEISKEYAKELSEKSNKAIYIIGRTAGEDKDYKAEKGGWYLSDIERSNLKNICDAFENVAIVFNTSGIIDTAFIDDEEFNGKIKSVIYVWQGGQESGRAAANVLCGIALPSGKLTDTIAKSIDDYPSTKEFAQKHSHYTEDIFVGYRYFNTFARDKILYPFGFGISYTQFALSNIKAKNDGTKVNVTVDIQNIGKTYAGKEIVQVYISAPQGKLGKSARELVGFAKTKLLNPSESETVEIEFNIEDFASYDDSGNSGFEFCSILEKGDYFVYVGTDSLSAKQIKIGEKDSINIEETCIIEKLEQCAAPLVSFDRIKVGEENTDGTFKIANEKVPTNKVDIAQRIKDNLPQEIPFTGNKGISFDDVKKDRTKLDDFIAQLDTTQLCTLVRGEGMLSLKVTTGIASAFGGVSESLHEYKIPCAGCADGPSGLRLDNGAEGSMMPIGTQLACSWNLDLIRELYKEEGKELFEHEIDTLLGPGINIHRNPLNGRNFEYFSEDPFLTGVIAKTQIKGLLDGGSNGTIKHFALNSQETMRRTMEAVVSERAMREIYLKPFEIAVKSGLATSIMTSYNCINGHWAASNYDIVNTILHKEWGYTGLVMTDWWASMNDCVKGGKESLKNTASMVRARNDVYMVVDNDGAESNVYSDNIEESLKNGNLTLGELQLCAKDILNFLIDAPVSKRPLRDLVNIIEYEPLSETEAVELEKIAEEKITNEKMIKGIVNFSRKEPFVPKEGKTYILTIENEAIYRIEGVYIKKEDNLSQSASNIYINDKPAASFECRTTLGKGVYVIANQVVLKKGKYKITISHTKPGIEILNMYFITHLL